jgi:hypothetical protein
MSLKLHDVSREQMDRLSSDQEMRPAFADQNPYIAIGPRYEMLAILMSNGLYELELLDRKQTEESVQQTIKAFKDFSGASGL